MGDAIHARSEGPRRAAVRGVGPRVLGDGVEAGAAVARPGRRRGRGCTGHHERAARPAVVDVRSKNIGGARPVSVETRPRIQSVKVVGARRRARAAASRPLLRSVERVAASDGSVPERAGRETELPRPSRATRLLGSIHVAAAASPRIRRRAAARREYGADRPGPGASGCATGSKSGVASASCFAAFSFARCASAAAISSFDRVLKPGFGPAREPDSNVAQASLGLFRNTAPCDPFLLRAHTIQ